MQNENELKREGFETCFNCKSTYVVYVIATDMNRGRRRKCWAVTKIKSKCYLLRSEKFSDIRHSNWIICTSKITLDFFVAS